MVKYKEKFWEAGEEVPVAPEIELTELTERMSKKLEEYNAKRVSYEVNIASLQKQLDDLHTTYDTERLNDETRLEELNALIMLQNQTEQ
jgi:hypothetical protein